VIFKCHVYCCVSTMAASTTFSSPPKQTANTHPYAIKTTSTSILSRSNSTSSPSNAHFYIPPSPSPSPTRPDPPRTGAGHRYSKSLSDQTPTPLPLPSSANHEKSPAPLLDHLPPNPKSWSPAQLSSYLSTALRVRNV
jgi:hypothetical protein